MKKVVPSVCDLSNCCGNLEKEGNSESQATVTTQKSKEKILLPPIRNVEGSFPTFVYLAPTFDLNTINFFQDLNKTLSEVKQPIINSIPLEEYHISLSKTVNLNFHQIDPFLKELEKSFSKNKGFLVSFSTENFSILKSEIASRWFLVAEFAGGKGQVLDIIKKADTCMKQFGLETFFEVNKSLNHTFQYSMTRILVRIFLCMGLLKS